MSKVVSRITGTKLKLLIVDDSEIVRQRMITILSSMKGIEHIAEAGGTTEAIEYIGKEKPEVVILDVRMSGGNGKEVLEYIRQHSQETLVIMLSNYSSPQYRKTFLEGGVDFFFDKSSEFEKVIPVIEKAMTQNINNTNSE